MNRIECKNFNLNDNVWVKLTDEGLELWRKDFHRYDHLIKTDPEYPFEVHHAQYTDSDGYSKFQLWVLMSIFGEHMLNGGVVVFEKNAIYIEENLLK